MIELLFTVSAILTLLMFFRIDFWTIVAWVENFYSRF